MSDDPLNPEITTETESVASDSMGKDLLAFLVQEFKAMPKPWQQLSEHEQNLVLDRARYMVEAIVHDAISILSGNGWISVLADIEGIAIKDHTKVTLRVSRDNSEIAMHELYGSRNQPCRVVLCSPESYTGGMDAIKGEADQRAIDLNVAEGEEDPLIDQAIDYVRATQKTGISHLQRKLKIAYVHAARIIEELEQRGVLSAADRAGNRKVIENTETTLAPTE